MSAVSTALPSARPRVGSTSRSAKRSAWFCIRVSPIGALSTSWAIWPAAVPVPTRSARTVIWPSRSTVAANTASPAARATGRPSPVMVFWSTSAAPSVTSPSTGIISPG